MAAHLYSDRSCLSKLICKQTSKYKIVPHNSGVPQGSTEYAIDMEGGTGSQDVEADVVPDVVPDAVPDAVLIAWTDR